MHADQFKALERGAEVLDIEAKRKHVDELRSKTLRKFVAERTTIDFLIDDLFRRGYLYTLTGKTGAGKTAVAVPITLSVVQGLTLCGHECQKGAVLYIAGENADDVRSRFVVALQRLTVTDSVLDEVHIIDRSFLLQEHVAELCTIIEEHQIALIVVDTDQAVSLNGIDDENSNGDRMEHGKRLRQLTRCSSSPTVIDLCHPRKNAGKDDLVPRGGSSLLNEVDGNLRLWRDGDVAELISDPDKFRGAPVSMSFKSELVSSNEIRDSKERQIPIPYFRPIDDSEAAHLQLANFRDENRLVFVIRDHPDASQADWAKQCGWIGEDGKPQRYVVNRLLFALEKAAPPLVKQLRQGKWALTPAGEKEAAKR